MLRCSNTQGSKGTNVAFNILFDWINKFYVILKSQLI